jgi:MGT family glycosyltransferase
MIVAFTIPAMGHVKPLLPILGGLHTDGHRVVCYGHAAFEGVIRATGVEFRPYPEIGYNIAAPDFNLVKMGADLMNASRAIVDALLAEVASLSPQLIVQDFMAVWASQIGTRLGVPRVHTVPTIVFNRSAEKRMREEDGIVKLARDVITGFPALVRELAKSHFSVSLREAFGLDGSWRRLAPPVCELIFCLEQLQVGDPQGDVPRHYIGPTFDERPFGESPFGQGYALITFGTLSNVYTQRFEAAIRGSLLAGFPVLAQCGTKVDLRHLRSVTASMKEAHPNLDVTLVEEIPRMEPLIKAADIVIHHAGMATTWETVRYRKPQLFIPTIADQKVFATELVRNGLGIRIAPGRECDAQEIARGLQQAHSMQYPWEKIEMLLEQAGGARRGVKVIRQILGTAH